MSPHLTTLQRQAARLRWLLRAAMALTALAAMGQLALRGPWALVRLPAGLALPPEPLTLPAQLLGAGLGLLEPALWLLALLAADRFVARCVRREPFSPRGARALRGLGWALVGVDLARMLVAAGVGPVLRLTMGAPPRLAVELQASVALVGVLLLLLASALDLGRELDENDRLSI